MSTINVKYDPPPSINQEMGVMFGFIGAMIVSMLLYGIAWQIGNKRSARKEEERVQALRASGWLKEKEERMEADRVERREPTTIG